MSCLISFTGLTRIHGQCIASNFKGPQLNLTENIEDLVPRYYPSLFPILSLRRPLRSKRTRADKKITPLTNISLSSLDEAVMPPLPSLADDFWQFQDLMKWIADNLQVSLEGVQNSHHKFLDILHTSASAWVALPINEALLSLPVSSSKLQ